MKKIMLFVGMGAFLALSLVSGESITASSEAFTFPPITGVKSVLIGSHSMYFRCSRVSPKSNMVTFAWSLPSHVKSENGAITVYSLVGKTIKTFKLTSKTGSIVWKRTTSDGGATGIYIVSFSFGYIKQNAKLIINK